MLVWLGLKDMVLCNFNKQHQFESWFWSLAAMPSINLLKEHTSSQHDYHMFAVEALTLEQLPSNSQRSQNSANQSSSVEVSWNVMYIFSGLYVSLCFHILSDFFLFLLSLCLFHKTAFSKSARLKNKYNLLLWKKNILNILKIWNKRTQYVLSHQSLFILLAKIL